MVMADDLGNIGGVIANLFPYFFTAIGVANVAAQGQLPASVKWSFYVGAIILAVSAAFTVWKVDEYEPSKYAEYHGISETTEKTNILKIIKMHLRSFGHLVLYNSSAGQDSNIFGRMEQVLLLPIFGTTDASSGAFQAAGNWFGVLSSIETVAAIVWAW